MSGLAPRIWSTCKGCNTHQWNHVLQKEGGKCRSCGRPVSLYQPKPKRGHLSQEADADKLVGGRKKEKGSKSGVTDDAVKLLDQTIAATTDPTIKQVLIAQRALLTVQSAATAAQPAEAARKAEGTWRDADAKHVQAVQHVIRSQENLARAEERERETALILAQATLARQIAVKALAQASGIAVDQPPPKKELFEVKWDLAFFENLDTMEMEESERQEFKVLEQQLKQAKENMATRSEEATQWLQRMKDMQKAVEERTTKKRKTEADAYEEAGGGVAAPSAPSAASPPPAASSTPAADDPPKQEDIDSKAAALSEARFKAESAKKAAEKAAKAAAAGGAASK